jgi:hypothetical protein
MRARWRIARPIPLHIRRQVEHDVATCKMVESCDAKSSGSVPGMSVGADVAPTEVDWPSRIETIERRLRKEHRVLSVREIAAGKTGMFDFHGPAVIIAAGGAFWVAIPEEGIGVLLVGSLKHVLGGQPPDQPPPLSPSMDPAPALRAFATGQGVQNHVARLVEAWHGVRERALSEAGGFESSLNDLPPMRGIAEYRARATAFWDESFTVVLGSPLWVESA